MWPLVGESASEVASHHLMSSDLDEIGAYTTCEMPGRAGNAHQRGPGCPSWTKGVGGGAGGMGGQAGFIHKSCDP